MKNTVFFIIMIMFLSGCASLHIKEVKLYGDNFNFPKTNYKNITLLERKPHEAHIEIAEIVAKSSNRAHIESALKKKAASLGASAVYIKEESQNELTNVTQADCGCGAVLKKSSLVIFHVTGVAIRYQ